MKECYFSPENLEQKALDIHREIGLHWRRWPVQFRPEGSALLVLDMQAFFLNPASHAWIPSGETILPGIRELTRAYSAWDLPIVFTRHINTPQDAGLMAVWWHDLIDPDSPLSAIAPELDTAAGVVIHKSQYDAFFRTPLEEYLRGHTVTQVVICGVMTHLCCETTARSAFMRGFEVIFLVDGTATYNERLHRAALLNLSHGFAVPMRAAEVLAALRDLR